ncbi:hypothetical protein CRUP_008035 [Coryphaenoides rupestris]|nr:hypothetical protein CRUP_008035 [Coryphaenoides rupestris]
MTLPPPLLFLLILLLRVPAPHGGVHPHPPTHQTQLVAEGKQLTFRIWYKDGELLAASQPGYIQLTADCLSITANAINEGTYTCVVRKKHKVLTTYSWRVRVRF